MNSEKEKKENKLSPGEIKELYLTKKQTVPQHEHHVAILPTDLLYLQYLADAQLVPLAFVQDQAFSDLYLSRTDRIHLRTLFLSQLGKNSYALFTRRLTATPYVLNDIIIGKDPEGKFFIRLIEEKQTAIGKQSLEDLLKEGRYYDRSVRVFSSGSLEHAPPYQPTDIQPVLDNALKLWVNSLINLGFVKEEEQAQLFEDIRRVAICGITKTSDFTNDELVLYEAVFENRWSKLEDLLLDSSSALLHFFRKLKQTDPYLIETLREQIARAGSSPHVDLRRSLQGPLFLCDVSSSMLPAVSQTQVIFDFSTSAYRQILNPLSGIASDNLDKKYLELLDCLDQRAFSILPASTAIYEQDPNMYVLSLGRAEIEKLIIHLIKGRQQGKPFSELIAAHEERTGGRQICVRHRDQTEVKAEITDPNTLPHHLTLFQMDGYFIIRDQGETDPFEVLLPAWNFFISSGLHPEKFWAVVHPDESAIKEMLLILGIPKTQISESTRACNWRQGGTPHPDLRGNLTGRNFELFYEMPGRPFHENCTPGCSCGFIPELLNVICIQGIENKEEKFDFEVWEAAFGHERLEMCIMAEEEGRPVSIYELPRLKKLAERINQVSSHTLPAQDKLTLQLTDLFPAAYFIMDATTSTAKRKVSVWTEQDYREVAYEALKHEGKMPRYRRIGHPLITEMVVICRQLGISRHDMFKLYISWLGSYNYYPLKSTPPIIQEFLNIETGNIDRAILHTIKDIRGPLYAILRYPQSFLFKEVAGDAYQEDLRIHLGLPSGLLEPAWHLSYELAKGKFPSSEALQLAFKEQLGIESEDGDVLLDLPSEAQNILRCVSQEQLRQAKQEASPLVKSPLYIKPAPLTLSPGKIESPYNFTGEILYPNEGREPVDMERVFYEASSRLTAQLPQILKLLDVSADVGIMGIGNNHQLAFATPHNMGWNVVEVIKRALNQLYSSQVSTSHSDNATLTRLQINQGTVTLLQNLSDMNITGPAIQKIIEDCDLEKLYATLLADDSRAHLGSWSPIQKKISLNTPHRGILSIRQHLGNLPVIPFGTFTPDQRGTPINNLLRQYAKENEEKFINALVLYAKRALLAFS